MDRARRIFFLIIHIGAVITLTALTLSERQKRDAEIARAVALTVTAYIPPTSAPTSTPGPTATFSPTPTLTPTPTGTLPPTPTPGPQFTDNCDQSPNSEWTTYGEGMWLTTNDRCLFLPSTDHQLNLAVVGEPYWESYAIEVELHYDRHDKDDYCGVVVLFQDERNYLYLSLGGRLQRIEWWMRVDGVLTLVPDTQQKSALKDGTDHRVRIEVVKGKIVTYLDDKEQSRFSASVFTGGLAGVLAYSENDAPKSMCAFERFRVSTLEP